MASTHHSWQPTPRDNDILAAIDLLPLTPEQLLKWSERFPNPFTQIGDIRRRLRKLDATGLVRRWPLAIESRGSTPFYHKLTPEGFRFLCKHQYGTPTRKRAFSPIGLALHAHTKALTDCIVHAGVSAHRMGATFTDLHPENAYRVRVGEESLKLDWRFSLVLGHLRRTFNIELDNSSESIFSTDDTDSIARKIRLLDADDAQYDPHNPKRAITLFVTTRSATRMQHILDAAAAVVRNPNRSLIYGVYLPDFLALQDPLTTPCFQDHRGRQIALLPQDVIQNTGSIIPQLAVAMSV